MFLDKLVIEDITKFKGWNLTTISKFHPTRDNFEVYAELNAWCRSVNSLLIKSISPLVLSIDGIIDRKVQFLKSVERLVSDLQVFKTSQ